MLRIALKYRRPDILESALQAYTPSNGSLQRGEVNQMQTAFSRPIVNWVEERDNQVT